MDGKTALPVKAWRAERDKLYVKYNSLEHDYILLGREVKEIEQMRRGLEYILREENRRAQPRRERPPRLWGMERVTQMLGLPKIEPFLPIIRRGAHHSSVHH
ncbi:MAG TPA: hypothetical protein DEB31_04385 [Clostridiales bacterium]|nr:hypothetical protein [Clostridiales bacterium]